MIEREGDRRLLVIGAGGHAKVVIDVARAAGWSPEACLDPGGGESCLGVPVLGDDDMAADLFAEGLRFAVIAIGGNALRLRLFKALQRIGYGLPAIVHPTAVISASARIGDGTVVMPNAVVNPDAVIGQAAIINTGVIVEHDCWVGDSAHLAPRSVLAGNVRIGARVLFGVGSVARPECEIGADTIVGAGSVIVSDFGVGPATILGVPARIVSKEQS